MDTSSTIDAPSAASSSATRSNPHAWTLAELRERPTNGLKVVSTFACGGGSSMGYKRAGFEVVCANDIDPEMAWHYQKNLKPPHYVLAPIKQLVARWPATLPKEIDLLDGSPPCSTFSTSGLREKAWGQKKHFREGQSAQVLDDLFFDFLDVVDALRPRAVIAENVSGLVKGNAKGYVRMIFERLRAVGYTPQLFLVNAARCGVPQARERVFVVARRGDVARRDLKLDPCRPVVTTAEACADLTITDAEVRETAPAPNDLKWWPKTRPGESYSDAVQRAGRKDGLWNFVKLHPQRPSATLPASNVIRHWAECRSLTLREWMRLGSFPDDYVVRSAQIGKYMIGMSVPPKMTEVVASAVRDQWLL